MSAVLTGLEPEGRTPLAGCLWTEYTHDGGIEMTDVAAKRGVRFVLLAAAGLAFISAAAVGASAQSIAADPESGPGVVVPTLIATAVDLFLGGILGWAAFRDRGVVIGVSLAAIVAALLVGLFVLDGASAFSNHSYAGAHTTAVLFFTSATADALVVVFAALELFLGRQRPGTSTSKPGVA
jgi:hypothetical protein